MKKLSEAVFQEWKQNPKQTAQKFGIDYSELENSVGRQDWDHMSYDQFKNLIKKSRWAGLWDWTA